MSSFAFIGLLALAAPIDKGPLGVRVTTSLVAERIPLASLRGPIELVVDSLGGRLELRMKKPQPALVAEVARHAGSICPQVIATATGLELRCRTRRFDAVITTVGSKKFLDIEELRGLPWREGPAGPPFFHYEPFRTGIGTICPGSNSVSRGECALLAGHQLEAATHFRSAIESGDGQLAALRLGDLSLATGDPATALGWYRRVGVAGIFARVARTRMCEIEGSCLASTEVVRRLFDPRSLPDPLRAEMTIRGVRAEAFTGRLDSATRMLWQTIKGGSLAGVCREGGEMVCRRVLLEAMRQLALAPLAEKAEPTTEAKTEGKTEPTIEAVPAAKAAAAAAVTAVGAVGAALKADVTAALAGTPPPTPTKSSRASVPGAPRGKLAVEPVAAPDDEPAVPEMAIEAYLSLPRWNHGPLAAELSEAAADLSQHMGAPVFGGNLLSAVAPEVSSAMLSAHLLRAAELYLEGDDIARTRLVIEYAHTRIGKKISARWIAVEKKLAARVAREEDDAEGGSSPKVSIDVAEVSREIAAARALSARARLARSETAPQKQGDKR